MDQPSIVVQQAHSLTGTVTLAGAKNAALPIIASLLLVRGISVLTNVPILYDVFQMCCLLESLGAHIVFDTVNKILTVDTRAINTHIVPVHLMKEIRASILLMGPLLATVGKSEVGLPGGDNIGARPIEYHLKGLMRMGASFNVGTIIKGEVSQLRGTRIVLDYPSVGATENILMAATLAQGTTYIINAALEPEVMDLIEVLQKMGACVSIQAPATIKIEGVSSLHSITHNIMSDRLEAGALLMATAITGGSITIADDIAHSLDVVLHVLSQMGHQVIIHPTKGITLKVTTCSQAISLRTMPYPGFPTDLQAPLIAALCYAQGTSVIEETVFENRFHHVLQLQKMGAHITLSHNKATIYGTSGHPLKGTIVEATDIRAACALILAGLGAEDITYVKGVHHFKRGFDSLDQKLVQLGGSVRIMSQDQGSLEVLVQPQHI